MDTELLLHGPQHPKPPSTIITNLLERPRLSRTATAIRASRPTATTEHMPLLLSLTTALGRSPKGNIPSRIHHVHPSTTQALTSTRVSLDRINRLPRSRTLDTRRTSLEL